MKSAHIALLTLLRWQFRFYYFVQKKNRQKNCANPQNPYCLQCCKQERFFILRHRSRALPKTIFTSGLQNGENFAFLRQFSAFSFFLLYFMCRLPFIIVQMLPFKRKLFWGLEYPFNHSTLPPVNSPLSNICAMVTRCLTQGSDISDNLAEKCGTFFNHV